MKNVFLFIKRVCVFIVFAFLHLHFSGNSKHQKNIPERPFEERRWTGTLTLVEKYTGITGMSERHVTVNFNNALPTLHRDIETTETDFTDDKGTGSETFHGELIIGGKKLGVTDCSGSGKTQLNIVDINDEDYYIHAIGPSCTGTGTNSQGETKQVGPYTTDIVISERLGIRQDILSGAKSVTTELPGETGTVNSTITWHLVRSTVNDVELIVTPEKYDTWLPEPGRNERTVGSVMNVSLKLQGRNGSSTNKKAKGFELRLLNTSTEPGMTINFPVNSSNTSPDLRFMPQANAYILDTTSQTMKIICLPSSQTGVFKIGSYDGGGWTILNVEATLEDGSLVQGRLLVSNGEIDIRIPKRDPNSKIGTYWLTANGNPNEMDDKETSTGNTNNGDGFTAYEEYRGVIAEGRFKRFNPKKKELGILGTQTDFTLFNEGISWFKTCSDLEPVRFDLDKEEISFDWRLNMNIKTAHDYDQYALFLLDGALRGSLGQVFSKTSRPDIPAQIISVVVDWNAIQSAYQRRINFTLPERLKFSVREYLAQTVAHELGHAVDVWHHGGDIKIDSFNVIDPFDRIFRRNGSLITTRPTMLYSIGEIRNTVESGDLKCILNYYPYYKWGYTRGADGAKIFNQEPLIPLGRSLCKTINGTDFNATLLYFGDGAKGNCLGQINLRN